MAVDEKGANFGFSGRGHDVAEDLAGAVDGTIEAGLLVGGFGGINGALAEEEVATSAATCFGFGQVRGVAVIVEYHVASMVADGGIGMHGEIIKKHVTGFFGFLGGLGLAVGDFIESNDDGLVDRATIVKKET